MYRFVSIGFFRYFLVKEFMKRNACAFGKIAAPIFTDGFSRESICKRATLYIYLVAQPHIIVAVFFQYGTKFGFRKYL